MTTVARTFRAAIRLGEDFITLEEVITLPLDASDEQIEQATSLGWRMYVAQKESAEAAIANIRDSGATYQQPIRVSVSATERPASDKQRNLIAILQDKLGWSSEQMGEYAREQSVDLLSMTVSEASKFIDGLQKYRREEGIIENFAKPLVTGQRRQVVDDLL